MSTRELASRRAVVLDMVEQELRRAEEALKRPPVVVVARGARTLTRDDPRQQQHQPQPQPRQRGADARRLSELATPPRWRVRPREGVGLGLSPPPPPPPPNVNAPTTVSRRAIESSERLYRDALDRRAAHEARQRQAAAAEASANAKGHSRPLQPRNDNAPIHERASQLLVERELQLAKARAEKDRLEREAHEKTVRVPVAPPEDRLVVDAEMRERRMQRLREEAQQREAAVLAQRARVNPLPREARLPNFMERQRRALEAKEEFVRRAEEERRKAESSLVARRPATPNATPKPTPPTKQPTSVFRKRHDALAHDGCTFQPQIDARSRELAPPRPSVDAVSNDLFEDARARAEREDAARKEAEARALRECTFRPETMSAVAPSDETLEWIRQRREERMRAVRWERELAEFRECTFRPATERASATVATRATPQAPPPPRGMDRFMERRRLARELEEERRMREAKAFGVFVEVHP